MLLVFLILMVVTVCVTIVCTYFLLNAEDYRWQWTSFLSAASTSIYVYIYSFYYFFFKTKYRILWLSFEYFYLICCSSFQDVRLVPDNILFWLHGPFQWSPWDYVWYSRILWDECFCAKNIFECENRLRKKMHAIHNVKRDTAGKWIKVTVSISFKEI